MVLGLLIIFYMALIFLGALDQRGRIASNLGSEGGERGVGENLKILAMNLY